MKEEKDKQVLQKYYEEIEDQKEQVNEKERAPYSKKRQSDHRLEIAIENFQFYK